MSYQHFLLVTDLREDADIVAQKARSICARHREARLSVLHIVKDTMVGFGYEMMPTASLYEEVDNERCQEARKKMVEFLRRNGLQADNQEVTTAISSSDGIINYCRKHDVDLVIIGRHDRHGISAWINGATADSIMPNIPCDILVVRLDKAAKQHVPVLEPAPTIT